MRKIVMANMNRKRSEVLRTDGEFKKFVQEISMFKSLQEKTEIKPTRITRAMFNQYKKYHELIEEIIQPMYEIKSNGKFKIELKENIKKRIGRSPDKMDALLNTFYPNRRDSFVCGVGEER